MWSDACRQDVFVAVLSLGIEGHEHDFVHGGSVGLDHCGDGDGLVGWVAVDAGGDCGDANRSGADSGRDLEHLAVARCELFRFAVVAAFPPRADGVKDPLRWQLEARSRDRVTAVAPTDCVARR